MDLSAAMQLIGTWWVNYDEGEFEVLDSLVTDDVTFSCRTDTGNHPYEDFIASTVSGRIALDAYHRAHRSASPYPLRHNASNIHITTDGATECTVRSYLFVTDMAEGKPSPLSSGIVDFTLRQTAGGLRVAGLHLVLDYAATKVWG